MRLEAQIVYGEPENVETICPANPETVEKVLNAPESDLDYDGRVRSNWVWIRLKSGDLALGVFPQAILYEEIAGDVDADFTKGDWQALDNE